MSDAPSPGRVLFVNENVGGHTTLHLGIRAALRDHPEVDAAFLDVPAPGLLRRIVRLPIPGLAGRDLDLQPLRAQLAKSVWVERRLRRLTEPVDVLHVYSQNAALLSASQLRCRPSVVSTDGSGTQTAALVAYREPTRWTPARVRLGRHFEQRVYDAATLVVAQSEWAAASLRDDYGIAPDRLRVIPFGVVVPEVVAAHDPSAVPEITFVGATMARKGGRRLLDVFRSHFRDRCRLNLVTRERVEEEPGVRVYSDVRPNDAELTEVLARSAVLAFPSETDTFGYAALEAMAVGVPVVGFDLNALSELVESGVTGILVEPDDAELAAGLSRLIDDHALRSRMGAAARARVLERFDARLTTAQLLEVLSEARRRAA